MRGSDLRAERIRQRLGTAKFAIELQARRHIAVLAVGLTVGGGAAVGGLAGELGLTAAGLASAASGALVVTQVQALGRLAKDWARETADAERAMETLMLREEE